MSEPIRYRDRATGKILEEQVYGESFLRWAYERPLGGLALHALVKRAMFSRWYGWRMDRPASRSKVEPFIRDYALDASEFADAPDSYRTFNDFFYRKLQPEARPICSEVSSVAFPADGRHLAFANIEEATTFYAKGQKMDLSRLLEDEALAKQYRGGALVISRLCPVDYHRYHFPIDCVPEAPRLINGPLFSVSPIALRLRLAYLWENKRVLTVLKRDSGAQALMLEIGATCVGGIHQSFVAGHPVNKGQEKGWFSFGGSMTMVLFPPGMVELDADLLTSTREGLETHALMGQKMGSLI